MTAKSENNRAQMAVAIKYLRKYRDLLYTVGHIIGSNTKTQEEIRSLDDRITTCTNDIAGYDTILSQTQNSQITNGVQSNITSFLKQKKEDEEERLKKFKSELAEKKKYIDTIVQTQSGVQDGTTIEFLVNQYNGTVDVLLPVQEEDIGLSHRPLETKLYEMIQESCYRLDRNQVESSFGDEKFITIKLNGVTKSKVAQYIMDNKTPFFSGERGLYSTSLNLKAAINFCFSYLPTDFIGSDVASSQEITDQQPQMSPLLPSPTTDAPPKIQIDGKDQLYDWLMQEQDKVGPLKIEGTYVLDKCDIPWLDPSKKYQLPGYLSTHRKRWERANAN